MEKFTYALVGNPNSGKTTLFNQLTGNHQHVGNWPGVTVERKAGTLKNNANIELVDLPGIYSLSPYSNEEIIARDYLSNGQASVIINIVDATNLERNLYLTTQLMEFGVPMVVALNQMDIIQKQGRTIDTNAISSALGLPVVEISALRGQGLDSLLDAAKKAAEKAKCPTPVRFAEELESLLDHLEQDLPDYVEPAIRRFYALKFLERDHRVMEELGPISDIDSHERAVEARFGDRADAVIANERYNVIEAILHGESKEEVERAKTTERIDRVILNRVLALPIFVAVIAAIYYIAISTVGSVATDWANDGVFGEGWFLDPVAIVDPDNSTQAVFDAALEEDEEADPNEFGMWVPGVPVIVGNLLENAEAPEWLQSLLLDGVVGGVGAVLGFVPQIMILFFLLAALEGCGYMARVTFILDRIFRRFGLSGKTFIPMIVGTGCGVPGIMTSRTIESESARHLTIMTTTFMPCSAKLPIIALITTAVFNGDWWVAPLCYFMGIASIVLSGIILKKTKPFMGEATPYIMELPEYRMPRFVDLLRSMWQRAWSFIRKAGTIILAATIAVWFLSGYGIIDGQFTAVGEEMMDYSFLAYFGNLFAWIFAPLGFNNWQSASSVVTGLIAKENVISTMAVLFGGSAIDAAGEMTGWDAGFLDSLAVVTGSAAFVPAAAFSFMAFQLLCCPCFAAMGAIKNEMGGFNKWFWAAIGWECAWAYAVALCIYQFGAWGSGGAFNLGTAVACCVVVGILWGLVRKPSAEVAEGQLTQLAPQH